MKTLTSRISGAPRVDDAKKTAAVGRRLWRAVVGRATQQTATVRVIAAVRVVHSSTTTTRLPVLGSGRCT
jgi:hypothetical protein